MVNIENNSEITNRTPIGFKTSVVQNDLEQLTIHDADIPESQNEYLKSIVKSLTEFIDEEHKGNLSSELRLMSKIESARLLFADDKKELSRKNHNTLFN